mmetsp:Transcript_72895/g.225411  ORF Transcript_72895/g.225411 Transcript_72895/m.225411 type:complete len:204 (-) Transcript_72895:208-819(-)
MYRRSQLKKKSEPLLPSPTLPPERGRRQREFLYSSSGTPKLSCLSWAKTCGAKAANSKGMLRPALAVRLRCTRSLKERIGRPPWGAVGGDSRRTSAKPCDKQMPYSSGSSLLGSSALRPAVAAFGRVCRRERSSGARLPMACASSAQKGRPSSTAKVHSSMSAKGLRHSKQAKHSRCHVAFMARRPRSTGKPQPWHFLQKCSR